MNITTVKAINVNGGNFGDEEEMRQQKKAHRKFKYSWYIPMDGNPVPIKGPPCKCSLCRKKYTVKAINVNGGNFGDEKD